MSQWFLPNSSNGYLPLVFVGIDGTNKRKSAQPHGNAMLCYYNGSTSNVSINTSGVVRSSSGAVYYEGSISCFAPVSSTSSLLNLKTTEGELLNSNISKVAGTSGSDGTPAYFNIYCTPLKNAGYKTMRFDGIVMYSVGGLSSSSYGGKKSFFSHGSSISALKYPYLHSFTSWGGHAINSTYGAEHTTNTDILIDLTKYSRYFVSVPWLVWGYNGDYTCKGKTIYIQGYRVGFSLLK